MAILSGRYGQVLWDPTGAIPGTPVPIASIKNFKLSLKTDKINVTCFGDLNKVYIPGMKDISGSTDGFWNSADDTLVEAADSPVPGLLKLVPNTTESTYFWSGLAYMDAELDTSVDGAPALAGTFSAAGPWTRSPIIVATGATAGSPGTWTPVGATPKANLAAMTGVTATPSTAWTTGQHMVLGDASKTYWNATAWVAGQAP